MPNQRINAARDSAGRLTARERESVRGQFLARWEAAGLDMRAATWPWELLSRYQDLARQWHIAPVLCGAGDGKRAEQIVDEMRELERCARLGLADAGLPSEYEGVPMVPQTSYLFDLQRRTAQLHD